MAPPPQTSSKLDHQKHLSSPRFAWYLAVGSGAVGLLYEVLWLRVFTSVLGSTTQAASAVVAVFLLGTALGSWWWSQDVGRGLKPFQLYAALESGAALSCALGTVAFMRLQGAFDSPQLSAAALIGIASLFMFVPCFLFGGCLPALAAVVRARGHSGHALGLLYGLATLGSALGAGLLPTLVRTFGYLNTLGMTTAAAIAAAMLALFASRAPRKNASRAPDEPVDRSPSSERQTRWLVYYGLVGFTGISFEIAWFRIISFVIHGSISVFATLLAVYIGAIGLGSLLTSRRARLLKPHTLHLFIALSMACAIPATAWTYDTSANQMLARVVACAALALPGVGFGALFPTIISRLCGRATSTSQAQAKTMGLALMSNTLGSVAGAFASGLLLLPLVGTEHTLCALAVVHLLLAVLVCARAPIYRRSIAPLLMAVLVVTSAQSRSLERLVRAHAEPGSAKVVALEENALEVLSVVDTQSARMLYGGPYISGSTNYTRRRTQQYQGHLPMLFAPDRPRVAEVGYGVGEIPRVVLLHEPRRLDLIEIDADMIRIANAHFPFLNQNASHDSRVRIHIQDGRRFLRANDALHDVIVSDSMMLISEAALRLYTVEHFETAHARLSPRGVMLLWVPLSNGDLPALSVIKTFVTVFEQTYLFHLGDPLDDEVFLLGFSKPPSVERDRLCERMRARTSTPDLLDWQQCTDFLLTLRAGPSDLKRLLKNHRDLAINRDLAPTTDFLIPSPRGDLRKWVLDGSRAQRVWRTLGVDAPELDHALTAEAKLHAIAKSASEAITNGNRANQVEAIAKLRALLADYPLPAARRVLRALLLRESERR